MPGARPQPLDQQLLVPTDADWAYLAGIVDGEGHYAAHGSTNSNAAIVVSMAEPQVCEWAFATFGGKIERGLTNGRGTTVYRWRISCLNNIAFATRKLAPHLRLKCDENEAMMRWADACLNRPQYEVPTSRVSPDERTRRGDAWREWREECQRLRGCVRETRTRRKESIA